MRRKEGEDCRPLVVPGSRGGRSQRGVGGGDRNEAGLGAAHQGGRRVRLEIAGRRQVEPWPGTGHVEGGRRLGLVVVPVDVSNI